MDCIQSSVEVEQSRKLIASLIWLFVSFVFVDVGLLRSQLEVDEEDDVEFSVMNDD